MYPNYQQMYGQMMYPQQQYQMFNQQQTMLGGKVVDSIDVVKATDVPMNGSAFYFPKADGTEIYSKRWLSNGTTQITTFKADFSEQNANAYVLQNGDEKLKNERITPQPNPYEEQIKMLEARIEKLEKKNSGKVAEK